MLPLYFRPGYLLTSIEILFYGEELEERLRIAAFDKAGYQRLKFGPAAIHRGKTRGRLSRDPYRSQTPWWVASETAEKTQGIK
jgi:hypothetical protein